MSVSATTRLGGINCARGTPSWHLDICSRAIRFCRPGGDGVFLAYGIACAQVSLCCNPVPGLLVACCSRFSGCDADKAPESHRATNGSLLFRTRISTPQLLFVRHLFTKQKSHVLLASGRCELHSVHPVQTSPWRSCPARLPCTSIPQAAPDSIHIHCFCFLRRDCRLQSCSEFCRTCSRLHGPQLPYRDLRYGVDSLCSNAYMLCFVPGLPC